MRLRTRLVLASLLAFAAASQGFAATLQRIEHFGPNPGQLGMYVYAPDRLAPDPALVVVLHGCTQGAADFDDESGLTALADALKFMLVFPEQDPANNAKRCFNWFRKQDNRKHRGESGSIRNMIQYAIDTFQVDRSRVFVVGLSAGGSMTAALLANYPGLFQGGAIVAGTPYDCNKPALLNWAYWWFLETWYGDAAAASYACGLFNYAPTQRSAKDWGDFVRASAGVTPDRWAKLSLWQGGADHVVNPANQHELVKQWSNVIGIDQTPDQVSVAGRIRHSVYRDADGIARLETYEIANLDHAMAIDPGAGPGQCGRTGPYLRDADICSALKILEFWGLAP